MRTMKILFIFLLVGLASASFHQELDDASNKFVLSFLEGMASAPSLKEYVEHEQADELDDHIKTELGKKLKEGLDRVLEKIKEAVHEGKEVKQEFLDKLKELGQKLRNIKDAAGDRKKEIIEWIQKHARDYVRELLEKYSSKKRSAENRLDEALAELNYKDMLRKLKEHLKNNVDPELLKEKISKIFDQGSEILQMLLKTLKEKGRRKMEILIDALLGDDEDEEEGRESRSIKDYWEKVKDYFKDLKIDLQEKYMKFGEWVKNAFDKGKENSKDKYENIKAIAREFARHVKGVSKEVGAEAKEFFKQYKEELGDMWDELTEAFKQIKQ